jgi:hypothetical protein
MRIAGRRDAERLPQDSHAAVDAGRILVLDRRAEHPHGRALQPERLLGRRQAGLHAGVAGQVADQLAHRDGGRVVRRQLVDHLGHPVQRREGLAHVAALRRLHPLTAEQHRLGDEFLAGVEVAAVQHLAGVPGRRPGVAEVSVLATLHRQGHSQRGQHPAVLAVRRDQVLHFVQAAQGGRAVIAGVVGERGHAVHHHVQDAGGVRDGRIVAGLVDHGAGPWPVERLAEDPRLELAEDQRPGDHAAVRAAESAGGQVGQGRQQGRRIVIPLEPDPAGVRTGQSMGVGGPVRRVGELGDHLVEIRGGQIGEQRDRGEGISDQHENSR